MQQVLLYVNAYAKTGNRSTFMYKKKLIFGENENDSAQVNIWSPLMNSKMCPFFSTGASQKLWQISSTLWEM